jgi:hypothetical protein
MVKKEVAGLPRYNAGLPEEYIRDHYRVDHIVRLASNENPFGIGAKAAQAAAAAVADLGKYSDPESRRLRRALAAGLGVERRDCCGKRIRRVDLPAVPGLSLSRGPGGNGEAVLPPARDLSRGTGGRGGDSADAGRSEFAVEISLTPWPGAAGCLSQQPVQSGGDGDQRNGSSPHRPERGCRHPARHRRGVHEYAGRRRLPGQPAPACRGPGPLRRSAHLFKGLRARREPGWDTAFSRTRTLPATSTSCGPLQRQPDRPGGRPGRA